MEKNLTYIISVVSNGDVPKEDGMIYDFLSDEFGISLCKIGENMGLSDRGVNEKNYFIRRDKNCPLTSEEIKKIKEKSPGKYHSIEFRLISKEIE